VVAAISDIGAYDLIENCRLGIMARSESNALLDIGLLLKVTRKSQKLTQAQVADMAGISRPRYREIEAGSSAARTTTLINIARALGLELMLIPQAVAPAVEALLRPHDDLDDLPAFVAHPDGDDND
jgi:transcriptional regulator with XRE-family HTH domain